MQTDSSLVASFTMTDKAVNSKTTLARSGQDNDSQSASMAGSGPDECSGAALQAVTGQATISLTRSGHTRS